MRIGRSTRKGVTCEHSKRIEWTQEAPGRWRGLAQGPRRKGQATGGGGPGSVGRRPHADGSGGGIGVVGAALLSARNAGVAWSAGGLRAEAERSRAHSKKRGGNAAQGESTSAA